MKKIVALALALALALSLATVSASAETISGSGSTASHDVKATYQSGGTGGTVYSVDITWGSMEFTYTAASAGTWDPETHSTSGGGSGTWAPKTADGDKITVTNHSNTGVTASLTYTPVSTYSGISGSFVMLLLGVYGTLIASVANLFPFTAATLDAVLVLLPFGIGVVIGLVYCSKLIKFLLAKFPVPTYAAIFGFVLGSIGCVFPGFGKIDLVGVIAAIAGILVLWGCERLAPGEAK